MMINKVPYFIRKGEGILEHKCKDDSSIPFFKGEWILEENGYLIDIRFCPWCGKDLWEIKKPE